MRVTCLKENLKNALIATEHVLGKNLTLPILSNFLISAENGSLKISATDLEIGLNYWTSCKVEKEGSVSVPGRLLTNLVSGFPDARVVLEKKDNSLQVRCENYKATLVGLDPKEFPIIPKPREAKVMEMDAAVLREGLLKVTNSAAITDSRTEINSVFLKIKKDQITIVATDSFRLAEKTIVQKTSKELTGESLLVPLKTTHELTRVLEGKNKVQISFNKNQSLFESEGVELFSRLIEGNFPDYEQILPKKYTTELSLNKDEFTNAIKVASLFSSKINDIKLQVDPDQKELEVSAATTDKGENTVKVKAVMGGDKQNITFNHRYLLDGLANIKDEKVVFDLSGESSPAVLKPAGATDYFYLIMPIKSF